ncbi:MAG TPA: hypothetical protein VK735_34965 [Pseudonocardia sp.]|jgi:hypothetical protein|nr:hypothetical protein [Pseudonocardia sp.]HTF52678.1 hypothetical protein [Pseudonocardia sp.]
MESFEELRILDVDLANIEQVFRGLSEADWRARTQLVPADPDLPHWTVFGLAGQFDVSIGLTRASKMSWSPRWRRPRRTPWVMRHAPRSGMLTFTISGSVSAIVLEVRRMVTGDPEIRLTTASPKTHDSREPV